jgi:hypothetical protein
MTGVGAQSDAAIKDEYACSTLPVRGPCKGPEQGGAWRRPPKAEVSSLLSCHADKLTNNGRHARHGHL